MGTYAKVDSDVTTACNLEEDEVEEIKDYLSGMFEYSEGNYFNLEKVGLEITSSGIVLKDDGGFLEMNFDINFVTKTLVEYCKQLDLFGINAKGMIQFDFDWDVESVVYIINKNKLKRITYEMVEHVTEY